MKIHCDVIRDLLPLYADEACSDESRRMVDEHLRECPECEKMLYRLRENEIETNLQNEKSEVLEFGARKFKKLSAKVGGTVSGVFMIPILVCLIVNIGTGAGMGWFFIVLASMLVAASLILVPIMMQEDKLFWTFCSFTASLTALLGVTNLVSHGHWFWIASSATLFGLSVFFLPFVIRAKPLKKWTEGRNKGLIVVAVDAALFLYMMTAISLTRSFGGKGLMFGLGCLAGIALAALEIYRKKGK